METSGGRGWREMWSPGSKGAPPPRPPKATKPPRGRSSAPPALPLCADPLSGPRSHARQPRGLGDGGAVEVGGPRVRGGGGGGDRARLRMGERAVAPPRGGTSALTSSTAEREQRRCGFLPVEALEAQRRVGEASPPLSDAQASEEDRREDEEQSELGPRVEHGAPSVPCKD